MLKYRPEIDGLRALAVLSVIFYHAGFNLFKGGYVGVDVFFVVSGFLITSIILNEVENKCFSILDFYERRARRILPALFSVMLVCTPMAWLVLEAKDLQSFFKSLYAIPTFTANIFFWKDLDYFATASELKPFIHTWSLAVEEQYYVVFPILFLMLGNVRKGKARNIILIILVCLAIFSLVHAQVLSSRNSSKNFFLLPSRFWEISLGAFVAFLPPAFFNIKKLKKQCLGLLGLLLVLCSMFIFTKETPFPGFYAFIPTVGSALIIMYASADTVIGKILSWKPFVWIGLISYSAYLWHQPIFAFNRYYTGQNALGAGFMCFLIFLSLFLAWLTWRFIEVPFKNKVRFKRSFIFKFSIFLSLFFILFGYGFSEIFHDYGADKKTAFLLIEHPVVYFAGIRNEAVFMENLINAQVKSPDIVVIGSSRIMQMRSPDQRKLLNLGVSSSSLRDNLGMIYLVDKKLTTGTILFGADPWLFSSQVNNGKYKTLENAYFLSVGKSGQKTPVSRVSYFKRLIQDFYDRTTYSMRTPVNELPEIKSKKRSDGSQIYDTVYISKSQKEIEDGFNELVRNYKLLSNYSDSNNSFARESAKNEFVKLIEQQRHKRKFIIVLAPFHPKLYARMKKEIPFVLEIEKEFKGIAKATGVQIIGSYDPNLNGCVLNDFFDGTHPNDLCMKKILDTVQ